MQAQIGILSVFDFPAQLTFSINLPKHWIPFRSETKISAESLADSIYRPYFMNVLSGVLKTPLEPRILSSKFLEAKFTG